MARLPTGTVTFLFTDLEDSSRLWEEHGPAMDAALAAHDEALTQTVARHGGYVFKHDGDGMAAAFSSAPPALAAAVDVQRAIAGSSLGSGPRLRPRIALHTGEASERDGNYFGPTLNRTGRLRDAAHGGQVVLSLATVELVGDRLPEGVELVDLGAHPLRGLQRPERVFQADVPGLEHDFPPLRTGSVVATNLRPARTSFVGRDDDVARINKLVADHRLVTLTGVGGSGKTRLAMEVAAGALDAHPDGVYMVELGSLSEPAAVASTVASAIGLRLEAGPAAATAPPEDALAHHLGRRKVLLVLDNCEHLLDACTDLADALLATCPHLTLLATSRESLGLDGERPVAVGSLSEADAVELFADRAASVRPDFELTESAREPIAEIVRRVDGIPLAVELAAARADHLSVSEIARLLEDRFSLLTGGRRRVQRQQTLHATLDWSHALLSEPERTLFRRLGVFAGPFTFEAAQSICGDALSSPLDLLASLVRKSLVIAEETDDESRYRLLETVRAYAEERLLESGEADAVRTRHRDWYTEWAGAFDRNSVEFVAAARREQDNLRAAIAWTRAQGDIELAARVGAAMLGNWLSAEEQEEVVSFLLPHIDELPNDLRAALLMGAGWAAIGLGRYDIAAERTAAALALVDQIEDAEVRTHTRSAFSLMASFTDPSRAVEEAERAYEDAVTTGKPAVIRYSAAWRGVMRLPTQDYPAVVAVLDPVCREIGLAGEVSIMDFLAPYSLSVALHLIGEDARALETSQLLLTSTVEGREVIYALAAGCALAGLSRGTEAAELLHDSAGHALDVVVPLLAKDWLLAAAVLAYHRGDTERAGWLLGVVRAQEPLVALRSPPSYEIFRRYNPLVRSALGEETSRRVRREGRQVSVADGIEQEAARLAQL